MPPSQSASARRAGSSAPYEVVIRPSAGIVPNFSELWAYRGLFWTLANRAITTRYKQTLIGILWAFARPIMTMVVLTVLFKGIAGMEGSTPITVLAGVVAWQLFANSLMTSTQSTVAYAKMISKVYFPRMIIPASASITALLDFLFGAIVLIALMLHYRVVPGWQVAALPLLMLMIMALSFGAGLWLSAINVKYRDVRQVLGYIITFGMLLSPVGYRRIAVPEEWREVYNLVNPMVSILDGFRWALLKHDPPDPRMLAVSAAVCMVILVTGMLFFHRMAPRFADVI